MPVNGDIGFCSNKRAEEGGVKVGALDPGVALNYAKVLVEKGKLKLQDRLGILLRM